MSTSNQPAQRASRSSLTAFDRAVAAAVALACLAMLAVGAWLEPSPDGHGTHAQLGLPACGWVQVLGKPCPTCGMTTAVSLAAHGRPVQSFLTQPAGFLVAVAAAAAFWVALHVAITGSRTHAAFAFLVRPRPLCILAAIWLGSWVYKIITW